MAKMKRFLIAGAIIAGQTSWVLADGLDSISGSSMGVSIGKVIKYILGLSALIYGPIGIARAVYAGIVEDNLSKAMTGVKTTTISVVILLSAWALTNYIIKLIQ